MSDVTVNDVPATRLEIVRPRIGAWVADVVLNAEELGALTSRKQVTIALPGLSLVGTASRVGVQRAAVYARILGGAGGLARTLPPAGYSKVPARIPLADALGQVGEVLSPSTAAFVTGTHLPKWARLRQTLGAELAALQAAAGAQAWRVMPDGSIWLGNETWGLTDPKGMGFTEIEYEPEVGRLTFVADQLLVHPGMTFSAPGAPYDGFRVSVVRHWFSGDRIEHAVDFEDGDGSGGSDRLNAGVAGYVAARVRPIIDYTAAYWAKVISQGSDGSVDVVPDSPRLPALSGVPIRLGLPGASVKVAAGARCVLEFLEADPTKPVVTLWGTATVTELALAATLIKLNAGSDALVKGTTYRSAEDTLLSAMGTAFAAIAAAIGSTGNITSNGPAAATAAGAVAAALTAFNSAAATYLSTTAKTA